MEGRIYSLGIINQLVLYNPNSQEHKGYTTSLRDNNFEKNLNMVIADTKIEANQLHIKFFYSDINNGRQNPTLKLLFAFDNIKSRITPIQNIAVLVITYHRKERLIFLND